MKYTINNKIKNIMINFPKNIIGTDISFGKVQANVKATNSIYRYLL